jgi:hypothetical protein
MSLEGKWLHHHGGDVCCAVLRLCVVVKLIVCKIVPEHIRKVNILPYYKVNGVIFCPTYACTIPGGSGQWDPHHAKLISKSLQLFNAVLHSHKFGTKDRGLNGGLFLRNLVN